MSRTRKVTQKILDKYVKLRQEGLSKFNAASSLGCGEAAIDAGTINSRETVYYYTFGPGKEFLEERSRQEE